MYGCTPEMKLLVGKLCFGKYVEQILQVEDMCGTDHVLNSLLPERVFANCQGYDLSALS